MSLGDSLRRALARWGRSVARPELLLCPRIPEPLHGVNPRSALGAKWWDATRKEAYRSTGYHCAACGVWKHNAKGRGWLEGHEVYEVDYLLGRMIYLETVPLCHFCHMYIHRGRLECLLQEGKITHRKYAAVIQHGDGVLNRAGLRKPVEYTGPLADWNDWRLVIDEDEYPPKELR